MSQWEFTCFRKRGSQHGGRSHPLARSWKSLLHGCLLNQEYRSNMSWSSVRAAMLFEKALWMVCKVHNTNENNGPSLNLLSAPFRMLYCSLLIAAPLEERNRLYSLEYQNVCPKWNFFKCLYKSSPFTCPKKKLATYFITATAFLSEMKHSRRSISFLPFVSSSLIRDPGESAISCTYFLAEIFLRRSSNPPVTCFSSTCCHFLGNFRVRKRCCKQWAFIVAWPS